MKAQNTTPEQLVQALALCNLPSHYDGNLRFKITPHYSGTTTRSAVSFGLTVNASHKRGGRRGFARNKDGQRRRIGAACWHAHGHFFEALYTIVPAAVVRTHMGEIIGPLPHEGNWQDSQSGSRMDPVMFSDLCDCGENNHDDWGMFPMSVVQEVTS